MAKCKILVVDDDDAIRNMLKLTLHLEGYDVDVASNGKEALDYLTTASPPPALVLLDLMMPVMDGWEFMAACNLNPKLKTIPIVILTAAISEGRAITDRKVFEKPINMDPFLGTVADYCKSCG
jgi:CheY-like chemotaxis protein